MKKIVTIFAFLLTVISLHAQEMQVKVYINGSVTAMTENEDVIQLSGCLTMPATAIDSIVYVLKDIDNLDFVDLGTGDGVLWANMNYGATEPTDAGELLPWARIGEVYEKWGKPWDRYVQTPTIDHLKNLRNNCVWEKVEENGSFKGFNVFKKKENGEANRDVSIFLPVTGYMDPEAGNDLNKPNRGYYWSSSIKDDYPNEARAMQFASDDNKGDIGSNNQHPRTYFYAIRPIIGGPIVTARIDVSCRYANRIASFSLTASVDDEEGELGDYGIEYRLKETKDWQSVSANSQSRVQVSNLSPGIYEYRGYAMVKGMTEKFYSHDSNYPTFEVPTVTAVVRNVRFVEYKNHIARFIINAAVDPEGEGELGSYGVEYRLQNSTNSWSSAEHTAASSVEIENLNPGIYEYRGYASLKGSTERNYYPDSNYSPFEIPQNTLQLKAEVVEGSLKYNSVTIRVYPEADNVSAFTLGEWGVYFNTDQSKMGSLSSIKAGEGNLFEQGSLLTLEVEPQKTYYYRAYAVVDGVGTMGEDILSFITPIKPDFVEPDSIDLGLPSGTLWGSFNLGAEDVYDAGNYYGWGDPTGKVIVMNNGSYAPQIINAANLQNSQYEQYDIVHVKLKGKWRMPSKAQMQELINNCTISELKLNYNNIVGLNGYEVKGPNGNTIFMAAGGYGKANNNKWDIVEDWGSYYWTSELNENIKAYYGTMKKGLGSSTIEVHDKYYGYFIRPVIPGKGTSPHVDDPTTDPRKPKDEKASDGSLIPQAGVDMGMTKVVWASWNLGAMDTIGTDSKGHYYAWGEPISDTQFRRSTYTEGYGSDMGSSIENQTGIVGSEHDAATQLWKDGWRMPTQDEIHELITCCSSEYAEEHGVQGIRFTSDNEEYQGWHVSHESIFFPFAAYQDDEVVSDGRMGGYWTSTYWDDGDLTQRSNYATYLQFLKEVDSSVQTTIKLNGLKGYWRYAGMLIRPVKDLPASTRQAREAYYRELESRRNANINE